MAIPDAAVAHVVPVPDYRLRDVIVRAIEQTAHEAWLYPRITDRLYESIFPAHLDEAQPPKWRGPRASGIHRCERALVREARIAHLVKSPEAKTELIFHTGHFVHAWLQARFPDLPAEETWHLQHLSGHSDQRFPPGHPMAPGGLIVDYKTCSVEDFVKIVLSGRPKNEHIVQASIYAVASRSAECAIVYLNKNHGIGKSLLSAQWQESWKQYTAWCKNTGHDPSTWIHVLRFPACPRLAAGADAKAKRVRDHVAAGTEPQCQEMAIAMATGRSPDICWDCKAIDDLIAASAQINIPPQASPLEDVEVEQPTPQEWIQAGLRYRQWHSKVVGRTYRGLTDEWLLHCVHPGDPLRLEWEPENPHEPNRMPDGRACAVKVIHEPSGEWLGYLKSTNSPTAGMVAYELAAGGAAHAQITELTGHLPDRPTVGINILITTIRAA